MNEPTRIRGGVGEALKPCPLCASPKVEPRGPGADVWSVLCFDCGAESVWVEGLDAAMDAWNKRPGEDAALARAEKAEAERDEALLSEHEVGKHAANTQLWLDDASLNLKAALARVRELEEGLRVACVSLEAEIRANYGDGALHPIEARRLERDLGEVKDLRVLLPDPPAKEPKA